MLSGKSRSGRRSWRSNPCRLPPPEAVGLVRRRIFSVVCSSVGCSRRFLDNRREPCYIHSGHRIAWAEKNWFVVMTALPATQQPSNPTTADATH